MDIDPRVEAKFLDTKKSILKIIDAVKDGQDKVYLEPLSKELVMNLYDIKMIINTTEVIQPESVIIAQKIKKLEKEIDKQNFILQQISKFE